MRFASRRRPDEGLSVISARASDAAPVIPTAHVRPASGPSLEAVRRAVDDVVAALTQHLDGLASLPPGPTSFARLADLNEPVRHALARWDRAVFVHTQTLPVAVDDGWPEDLGD